MGSLTLLTWNLLHGGGTARMPEMVLALLSHGADVLVLTEFRSKLGGQMAGVLADHGFGYQIGSGPPTGKNGILVASKVPMVALRSEPPAESPYRWVDVHLPGVEVSITGVHIPDDSRPTAKALFWRAMLEVARERCGKKHVFIGDLNTGRHGLDEAGATFGCTVMLGNVCTLGYRDAWRAVHGSRLESTWQAPMGRNGAIGWQGRAGAEGAPRGAKRQVFHFRVSPERDATGERRGFRLDSALVSGPLAGCITDAAYSHRERHERLSDHSALIVRLESGAFSCQNGGKSGVLGAHER